MRKNYKQMILEIQARLNPENILLEKAFRDEISSISYSDILVYIRTAMKSVPPEYTQRSKDAGERVKNHLREVLAKVIYKYQGSVMTNTHIKGVSDIDLLVICDKFYTLDTLGIRLLLDSPSRKQHYYPSQIDQLQKEVDISSYSGDSLEDLRNIRITSERKLSATYSQCDTNKPKAIRIKNLDLNREVDIVTANWYDGISSIINNKGDYRGIQIYDKHEHKKGPANYPFLGIARINERNGKVNGRLGRMIRFLKNVKADSDYEIKLSSFDINAICYDLPVSKYENATFLELALVLYAQTKSICTNVSHSDNVKSVDDSEYIFKDKPEKLEALKQLLVEVEEICVDLMKVKTFV